MVVVNITDVALNLTVGDISPYYQNLMFFQQAIENAYKTPVIAVLLFLHVAMLFYVFRYRLTRFLLSDDKFCSWLVKKGFVTRDEQYDRVLLELERIVLWLFVLCVMLVASLLFLKFNVTVGWDSAVVG